MSDMAEAWMRYSDFWINLLLHILISNVASMLHNMKWSYSLTRNYVRLCAACHTLCWIIHDQICVMWSVVNSLYCSGDRGIFWMCADPVMDQYFNQFVYICEIGQHAKAIRTLSHTCPILNEPYISSLIDMSYIISCRIVYCQCLLNDAPCI